MSSLTKVHGSRKWTNNTFNGQHWTNICKWRAEQMVSQWMLTPNCWICQQRMACDDLRSCKSAIRSSEDRYVQVDRSPQHLLPNRFSGRKNTHLGLFHCFLFFPTLTFPNPACSSSLPHVPCLFPVKINSPLI